MTSETRLPLKVINLWGAPGVGKSTTAAGLFNLMKHLGHEVELVTEVAKDFVYEKRFGSLQNQFLVTAEQDQRLRRLVGEVEWAITDSPLPLALVYATAEYDDWLEPAVMGAYKRYQNFDFYLRRTKAYAAYGRMQSEAQALALDIQVLNMMAEALGAAGGGAVATVDGDAQAPANVYRRLPGILQSEAFRG